MSMLRIRLFIVSVVALFIVAAAPIALSQATAEGLPQPATHLRPRPCSIATIAGAWVFATDIADFGGTVHMSALGTYNIALDGAVSGTFDRNLPNRADQGLTYTGTVTVNPDCTGIVEFTDSTGTTVVQHIVIGRDGNEIWGMFFGQPLGLIWTYKAMRVHGR